MATVKYIGVIATTFNDHGEVEPGEVFDVPDDQVGAYTRRADIERVDGLEPLPLSESEHEPTATDAE